MSPIKNIIKNGLLLFAVGLSVAYAAPVIANLIGPALMGETAMEHAATSMASAMWTGVVFGAFGAIHAALTPAFDYLFGDKKKEAEAAPEQSTKKSKVMLVMRQPEAQQEEACACKHHAASVEKQRILLVQTPQQRQ